MNRHATTLLASSLLLGCEAYGFQTFAELEPPCPAVRLQPDGGCCPAWASWEEDRCLRRPWNVGDTPQSGAGAGTPRVTVDDGGRAIVAWSTTDGRVEIGEETSAGALSTFSASTGLPGTGLQPDVASDETGRAMVAFRQQDGDLGRIYVARRGAEGGWDLPDADDVWSHDGNAYEPRVAFGPEDESIVLWNQWTGANFQVAVTRTWLAQTDPVTFVSEPVNFSNAPRIAVSRNGDGLIAWYQARDGELSVYVSERFGLEGEWSVPGAAERLSPRGTEVTSHPIANPIPVVNDRGLGAVAWTQPTLAGGNGVYVATRDGFGAWTLPTDLADMVGDPVAVARCVQPALSNVGQLHLVWHEEAEPAVVRAWSVGLDDDREAWPEPIALSNLDRPAVDPAIAIGAYGEVVVVYRELVGDAWRVVARQRHPDNDAWLSETVLSETSQGSAGAPAVAMGPDARVVVAWPAGEPGQQRIRLAWIDPVPRP